MKKLIILLLILTVMLSGSTSDTWRHNYDVCKLYVGDEEYTFNANAYMVTWVHQMGNLKEVKIKGRFTSNSDEIYYFTGDVSMYCYYIDNSDEW
jgi:hypothetical protein